MSASNPMMGCGGPHDGVWGSRSSGVVHPMMGCGGLDHRVWHSPSSGVGVPIIGCGTPHHGVRGSRSSGVPHPIMRCEGRDSRLTLGGLCDLRGLPHSHGKHTCRWPCHQSRQTDPRGERHCMKRYATLGRSPLGSVPSTTALRRSCLSSLLPSIEKA